jgi:hypothetical protein
MINTNPELIVPYNLPDITLPVASGESFDDAVILSLRILNQWFLEPNKVVILDSYKVGEVPMLVVRYTNKKIVLRIDYIEDYRYSDDLKTDIDVLNGSYTEALRTFASDNNLLPVIAGVITHTNKKEIKRDSNIINVMLNGKEIYISEPLLMIAEAPSTNLKLNYPYPLYNKEKASS